MLLVKFTIYAYKSMHFGLKKKKKKLFWELQAKHSKKAETDFVHSSLHRNPTTDYQLSFENGQKKW